MSTVGDRLSGLPVGENKVYPLADFDLCLRELSGLAVDVTLRDDGIQPYVSARRGYPCMRVTTRPRRRPARNACTRPSFRRGFCRQSAWSITGRPLPPPGRILGHARRGQPFSYGTGYSYWGQLNAPMYQGKFVKSITPIQHPEDIATRQGHRGVLFADALYYTPSSGLTGWTYYHYKDAAPLAGFNRSPPRGMHVAYSDGSVVWQALDPATLTDLSNNLGKFTLRSNSSSYYMMATLEHQP